MKSCSKISTRQPRTIAVSFSRKFPEVETVAMEVFIAWAPQQWGYGGFPKGGCVGKFYAY